MNKRSQAAAQRRADDIRVFQREVDRLHEEGVLTLAQEQRVSVVQHHDALLTSYEQSFDIDRDSHARQLSLGMRIASFLGALALAASVFFLFNQYWGLFPTPVQMSDAGWSRGSFPCRGFDAKSPRRECLPKQMNR